MRTRPKKLVLFAALLFGIALALPIQIMLMYGHPPHEIIPVLAKLSPLNWAIVLLAPLTAVLFYQASSGLVVAVPMLVAAVGYNNYLVATIGTDYTPIVAWLSTVLFMAGLSSIFTRDVRELVLNPRRRWWLTPERKRKEIAIRMKLLVKDFGRKDLAAAKEFYTKTYDISEGGAFIPFYCDPTPPSGDQSRVKVQSLAALHRDIRIGTQVYVCLPLDGMKLIQCRAEVVRSAPPRGAYPGGVGIRFLGLSWKEQRMLSIYLSEVRGAPAQKQDQTPPMAQAA